MMMVEKNSRQVLQPLIDWMHEERDRQQQPGAGAAANGQTTRSRSSLATPGIFWVGTGEQEEDAVRHDPRRRRCSCSTSSPREQRHPLPVVLVHGGGGQMVHYMGLGGMSGWAHHFVQAGYKVYLVDRPGHGRSPYHPDALGEIGPLVTYDLLTRDTVTSRACAEQAVARHDAATSVIRSSISSLPRPTRRRATRSWRRRCGSSTARELVDRVGPCDHHDALRRRSVRLARRQRAAEPGQGGGVVRRRDGAARRSGRRRGYAAAESEEHADHVSAVGARRTRRASPILDALTQSGAKAELIDLKERGILGNSHFAMFENNRRQVFEVISGWIEQRVPANTSTACL